jgi:hypothetical protein
MARNFWFRLAFGAAAILGVFSVASAQPVPPKALGDIFAPLVVGTPPVNAFNGLFRCPDGEIRHYGDDGFLFSRDNGLTWAYRRFGELDAFGKAAGGGRPLGMAPQTGTCLQLVGSTGGMFVHRSTDGPDGSYTVQQVDDRHLIMVRPPYFLQSRQRVLFAAHGERPARITVFRSDGRVLLLWCNTTPLPEIDRTDEPIPETAKNGRWEDVFSNRDACHAAISDDDGRTWVGFRELRLNPWRNACDYGKRADYDFSVHQPQALELPGGKVLVALGQDAEVRALMIFDPGWLYEPRRRSTFENDLADWSTHKYVKGIVGHCAYDRVPGARLIVDRSFEARNPRLGETQPRGPGSPRPAARLGETQPREGAKVLQFRHPVDPRLVFDKDGAVWNFPAAVKGSFATRIKLLPGGGGGRICLVDRWFNPTDPVVRDDAMVVLTIPGDGRLGDGVRLEPGRWHELRFDWSDSQSARCQLTIDGTPTSLTLPLVGPSINGISYVHFQALSDEEDLQGFLVESVEGGK